MGSPKDPSAQSGRKCDLAIVTDSTGSMGSFLTSLQESIPQIVSLLELTGAFRDVGVLEYKDYCDPVVSRFSGWSHDIDHLTAFALSLDPNGGGDAPEAARTALVELVGEIEKRGTMPEGKADRTVVLWYADAPPHELGSTATNAQEEEQALGEDNLDWVKMCRKLKSLSAVVYPMLDMNIKRTQDSRWFLLLAALTNGKTFRVGNNGVRSVTSLTINLLLGLMGSDYSIDADVMECTIAGWKKIANVQEEMKLPGIASERLNEVVIKAMPEIETDVYQNSRKIDKDEVFANVVFAVFDRLVCKEHVLSLTTNPIFGAFWRAICKRRLDVRRDVLLNNVTRTMAELEEEPKKVVSEWIANSYNQLEEVLQIIANATQPLPCVVLESSTTFEAKELHEIARSCSPGVLQKVGALMTNLRIVHVHVSAEQQRSIPWSVSNKDLFAILPHLMAEGAFFSMRPSVVLATLALVTHCKPLEERAAEFLKSWKGKWYSPDVHENFSHGFAKLILRLPAPLSDFLTEEEETLFTFLRDVGGLTSNWKSTLPMVLPFTPSRHDLRRDHKRPCTSCGLHRSITLLTTGDVCGLCRLLDNRSPQTMPEPTKGEDGEEKWSHLVECRTCHVIYAVVNLQELKTEPKCHYCRTGTGAEGPAPYMTCDACSNKFLRPALEKQPEAKQEGRTGVCAECQFNRDDSLVEHKVEIEALAREDPDNLKLILQHVNLQYNGPDIYQKRTLFNNKDLFQRPPPDAQPVPKRFVFKGKEAKNVEVCLAALKGWLQSAHPERGDCMLCFRDVTRAFLLPVCGRVKEGCAMQACNTCLDRWYGASTPGNVLLPPQLLCPFCKKAPKGNVLRRHNKEACTILKKDEEEWSADWFYGWCKDCYMVKRAVQRQCATHVPNFQDRFSCEECVRARQDEEAQKAKPIVKLCPGCKQPTEKTSGCNHIECPICSTCWCYACGKKFEAEEIYDHLYSEHGNIGLE